MGSYSCHQKAEGAVGSRPLCTEQGIVCIEMWERKDYLGYTNPLLTLGKRGSIREAK